MLDSIAREGEEMWAERVSEDWTRLGACLNDCEGLDGKIAERVQRDFEAPSEDWVRQLTVMRLLEAQLYPVSAKED